MSSDRLMRIHSAEFNAMSERVLRATELTSRLNVLAFEDEAGKAALFKQLLGRPLPDRVTIYPPFFTDHGLSLDLAERVFINQNCTFLDYAGIRRALRTALRNCSSRSPPAKTKLPRTRSDTARSAKWNLLVTVPGSLAKR